MPSDAMIDRGHTPEERGEVSVEPVQTPQVAPPLDLAARPRRGRPRRIRTEEDLNQTIDRGIAAVEAGDRQVEAEAIRELRDVITTPSVPPLRELQTPPQVAEPTTEQIEEQVQATDQDAIDTQIANDIEIANALAGVLPSTGMEIPHPRYGNARDNIFVVEVDGNAVPLRFILRIDLGFNIESREEYPLVVREEIRQIEGQLQKKAMQFQRHMQMRFMKELKREMLEQALIKRVGSIMGEGTLERMRSNGQFQRIVDEAMKRLQARADEAYAQDHPTVSEAVPASEAELFENSFDDVLASAVEVPPSLPTEGRPATMQVVDEATGQEHTVVPIQVPTEPDIPVPNSVSISAQGNDDTPIF